MQDALAGLTDAELHALIAASNGAPPVAYGLLVWIEGACDWELNRRVGHDYELLPPEAAIDPSEDKVSIEATYAIRGTVAGRSTSGRTAAHKQPEGRVRLYPPNRFLCYPHATPSTCENGLPNGKPLICLAPRPGLEPGTCGLTVRRSTN